MDDMEDDESVAAVETSNRKGKSKKRKKSKKKKKKASKSKKNRTSNSSSSSKVANCSSTNNYYWGANGGVSLKVAKRVATTLISIACLLSMTFGQGNIEEQKNDSSPKKKQQQQQQRQHKSREGLITNAQHGEAGEGPPPAARILQFGVANIFPNNNISNSKISFANNVVHVSPDI